tara:strand:+ start:111 stop:428 length:318 start_codon:yes stop_codon:yes gene_type:complete
MSATFNWQISQCDRELSDGGITTAFWRVNASQTVEGVEYTTNIYGACRFTPDPSASDYTPYDSVTEAEVLGWCWANGIDREAIEASLEDEIDAKITPTSASGVPW